MSIISLKWLFAALLIFLAIDILNVMKYKKKVQTVQILIWCIFNQTHILHIKYNVCFEQFVCEKI